MTANSRGFTLIEMLVVMVLLGMMTSLALPAMQKWHDAVLAKSQAAELVQSVRNAIFAAGVQRRVLRLGVHSFEPSGPSPEEPAAGVRSSGETVLLRLPPGWRLSSVDEAVFLATGLCEPGTAILNSAGGATMALHIRGPICEVALEAVSEPAALR